MRKLLVLLLALLCLAGCTPARSDAEQSGQFGLWFAAQESAERSGPAGVLEFEPRSWKNLPAIRDLLDALLAGPTGVGMTSPFPAGVRVLNLDFDHSTETLFVNLSEQYSSLSGYDLTVADACIVMTLSQNPGVKGVRILVEGEPLPYRNRQTLQQEDLLLTGITEQPESFMAVLYFPAWDGQGLKAEYRQVERYSDNPTELVLTELLRGPVGVKARPALPEGTQILSLSIRGNVCQIDLSSEFVDNAPQGPEAAMNLYALVNTLCTLSGIGQVRVMVGGAPLQDYHGIAVNSPTGANFELVSD